MINAANSKARVKQYKERTVLYTGKSIEMKAQAFINYEYEKYEQD